MPGSDGIVTERDGSRSYFCGHCKTLGQGHLHPIPAGVDQDAFAAQHRRENHKYPPVGFREGELRYLGLGRRSSGRGGPSRPQDDQ